MKTKILSVAAMLAALTMSSCVDLDMQPLDKASTQTWFNTPEQVEMSLNTLWLHMFWPQTKNEFQEDKGIMSLDEATDDWSNRTTTVPFVNGTLSSNNSTAAKQMWFNTYKGISRVNTILENVHKVADATTPEKYLCYQANGYFLRACFYSRIISLFGDPVYFTKDLTLAEAFKASRIDKMEALQYIYDDFDLAIKGLPVSYPASAIQYATKGAAYAMKARIALYMKDYAVARDAANECIKLDEYSLYSSFSDLFLNKTHNSKEAVFCIPRSVKFNNNSTMQYLNGGAVTAYLPRTIGGTATGTPSWDLFCSFLCSDGKTIDVSPLYNPRKPFENRDPRCAATVVEFGTNHCGVSYTPHPDSVKCWSYRDGMLVKNMDSKASDTYASYNGLALKKGVDTDWTDDLQADPDKMIMRYADVLLMYAEAKIELNEIDETVLKAINMVRARAYGAEWTNTSAYPQVTETDQTALRRTLRIERRMEFAFEQTRLYDILRWRIAEFVLNRPSYGIPASLADCKKLVAENLWFMPGTPRIDENGCPDFSQMQNLSRIRSLAVRSFDPAIHYLWPLPVNETIIGENIKNNPFY